MDDPVLVAFGKIKVLLTEKQLKTEVIDEAIKAHHRTLRYVWWLQGYLIKRCTPDEHQFALDQAPDFLRDDTESRLQGDKK